MLIKKIWDLSANLVLISCLITSTMLQKTHELHLFKLQWAWDGREEHWYVLQVKIFSNDKRESYCKVQDPYYRGKQIRRECSSPVTSTQHGEAAFRLNFATQDNGWNTFQVVVFLKKKNNSRSGNIIPNDQEIWSRKKK